MLGNNDNIIGPYKKDSDNILRLDYDKLKPDVKYLVSITSTCALSSMQLGAALSATASTWNCLKAQLHIKAD